MRMIFADIKHINEEIYEIYTTVDTKKHFSQISVALTF